MIFDTHAHYDDEAFDNDRDEVLTGLYAQGVDRVANVGVNEETCAATLALAEKYPFVYAVIGYHPSDIRDMEEPALERLYCSVYEDPEEAKQQAKAGDIRVPRHPRVVAIGEIGLDYHWSETEEENEKQKIWFKKQIEIAKKVQLPIVVHSREAAWDTMNIIVQEDAAACGGIIHCYSYAAEQARQYADMGFFIGVGGVITFKNSRRLRESVIAVGPEHVVLETDCPYLAPEPHRGHRNTSAYLVHVVRALAEIWHLSEEEVIDITTRNAEKVYSVNRRA